LPLPRREVRVLPLLLPVDKDRREMPEFHVGITNSLLFARLRGEICRKRRCPPGGEIPAQDMSSGGLHTSGGKVFLENDRMKRLVVAVIAVALVLAAAVRSLTEVTVLPKPEVERNPEGISQRTVKDVEIERNEWLSPTRKRIWVKARVGEERTRSRALLVDLERGHTLWSVDGADPIAWLSDSEVLFCREESRETRWKKILRKIGGGMGDEYQTSFFRFDVVNGVLTVACEVTADTPLTFFAVSQDRRWGVGTWSAFHCVEIDLQSGAVSDRIDEDYVWSPCFMEEKTYLFVGETSIQSREVSSPRSERISQPLLEEIREAIIEKGTPSIRLCGRQNGTIVGVDHSVSQRNDRLLVVDERTSLVDELTRLKASRELPRFNEKGTAFVYQGNLFERNMDSVFYQEMAEDSEPFVVVEGKQGEVSGADPLFLDRDTILYVHWGTELVTLSLTEGIKRIHWPIALAP
jgi:hypothetical protein